MPGDPLRARLAGVDVVHVPDGVDSEVRHNVMGYEAAHVALAARLDPPLLTADRRLAQSPSLTGAVELF